MATICIISVITSPPLPLDVLRACSTNWCTCMRSHEESYWYLKGLEDFLLPLTKVTTVQSRDVDRGIDSRNWSGWTFRTSVFKRKLAPCSSFCLLVYSWWKPELLLCLSLSRFERFSDSLVCNVLPILAWWFPPLWEYFLLAMRS